MLKKNVAKCLKDIEKIMKKYVIILEVSKNMNMGDRLIQGLLELLWTVYSVEKDLKFSPTVFPRIVSALE